MKAICTGYVDGHYTFKIDSYKKLTVSKEYVIENVVGVGSAKQNRTFHPLIDCLYSWMLEKNKYQFEDNGIQFDFRCEDRNELKKIFKMRYGVGACSWEYVNDKFEMKKVYDKYKIPKHVVNDFNKGNRFRVKAVDAVSWSIYDKEQRANLITNTINVMRTVGVDSAKFHEILEGINYGM